MPFDLMLPPDPGECRTGPGRGVLGWACPSCAALAALWCGLVRVRHRPLLRQVDGQMLALFGLDLADIQRLAGPKNPSGSAAAGR